MTSTLIDIPLLSREVVKAAATCAGEQPCYSCSGNAKAHRGRVILASGALTIAVKREATIS
jgi:hypothetical protein